MQRAIQYVLRQLAKIWSWTKPYLTWKMFPIVLSIWVLTNGIWYVLAFMNIGWISWAARAYLAFLYMPFTPEKIIIIIFAPIIYRFIYREDFKKENKNDTIESKS